MNPPEELDDSYEGTSSVKRARPEDDQGADKTPSRGKKTRTLRIAVAGCSHGEMDRIYGMLTNMERSQGIKFDLLLCCGDFQVDDPYSFLSL